MTYTDLFNQDKVTRQELASSIADLSSNHNNFLLDLFQRTGKTACSMNLCKNWEGQILILTPNTFVLGQWQKNLKEYNPELINRSDLYCYQSLHKIDPTKYQIVLLDEFHLVTEKRMNLLLEFMPYVEHWIGMSGTMDTFDRNKFRLLTKNEFFHAKVDLKQAVSWGILPQPKIFCVPLQFKTDKVYKLFTKGKDKKKKNDIVPFNQRWESLKNNKVNTLIQCTEEQYNTLIEDDYRYWDKLLGEFDLPEEEQSDLFKRLTEKGLTYTTCNNNRMIKGLERKKFYASLKIQYLKKLLTELGWQDKRIIVFCQDIKQAELVNESLAIHSQKENPLAMVQDFNEGKTNLITCVELLSMGVDINNVDYSIILQLAGSDVNSSQKFARGLLSAIPKTIVFYYPGTQDEKYLNNFLTNFDESWVKKRNLD